MSENKKSFKTNSRNRFRLISTMMVLGFLALQSGDLFAQGNLLITPRRVAFDGSRRSVDLNLANSGQDSATYAISLVQIRMTETGGFETITEPDPGQRFADGFVRFFPRSVTLAPNEAQVIKIEVTRRSQLEEGDPGLISISRAVPRAKPLGGRGSGGGGGFHMGKIDPCLFNVVTAPVIIQMGESTTGVTLSDLKLNNPGDKDPNLEMTFNRSGNMSVYGDLTVDHVRPRARLHVSESLMVLQFIPRIPVRKFNLNVNS